MTKKDIDLKTPDGICDTYVSYPDSGGPFPGVLIYMDGPGIRPELKAMADRVAAQGYFVILPNLFYRFGRAPLFDPLEILKPENRPKIMEYVSSLTQQRVLVDSKELFDYLDSQKEVDHARKFGLVGYCMGGKMVMQAAAAFPGKVAAGASFHGGRLATDTPDSPHRLAGAITAELYFGHADQDPSMPADTIKTLEDALTAAGITYESEIYAGSPHGYSMADLPHYHKPGADRHWDKLLGLFKRALKNT